MKLTVLVQYYGSVIHAGGHMTYRSVTIDLTDEQVKALALRPDEEYGPIALNDYTAAAPKGKQP